ncbi:MAG: HAD-IA family hydrolase [Oligoflexia bacterium]|nr:HAD-IA family hydrolase [Oligoflexia bacterium]
MKSISTFIYYLWGVEFINSDLTGKNSIVTEAPLFDLGNVIIEVDFRPFLSWVQQKSNTDENQAARLLGSSLFFDFEFGNVTRKEFHSRVNAHYRMNSSEDEFFEKFCSIFPGEVPGMFSLLEELSDKTRLFCLSNTNEVHLSYCLEKFPKLKLFSSIYASHEMKKRKPYPGIYRDVARSLDLNPRSLVFFDDVEANIEGARKAGLQAEIFNNSSQVRDVLKDFLNRDDKA